jgi:thiol-disulfide isomerase/thioredoxin
MLKFLDGYANLLPDAAALMVAFALASWFGDCFAVAPLLYLLGPDNEATHLLRLLGFLCRRPILVSDIDVAALGTLPRNLDPTLLVNQRDLGRRVMRVLLASNDRHFSIARGKGAIYAYGAKAFASVPEFADARGVRVSLSPTQELLPMLTDASETEIAKDFQSKLLRFRMVNRQRVYDAELDTQDFVPAMREEVRAWLAPLCDCPDLRKSVWSSLMEQSREREGARLSDERCVVAEAALLFCHKADTEHFFVGDLAEKANDLLQGRHEERVLTNKKVGLVLRDLGIKGKRVVEGYRILLTESMREKIHGIARAYRVVSTQDGVARCRYCMVGKVNERLN